MADVMALVSKGMFDKQARAGARTLGPGEVWRMDRYVSGHKAFEGLSGGGHLVLVTVRPPDERLWRVAVLENPAFVDGAWVAAANAVPIEDVSHIIPHLKTATGKGVAAAPGKLGMSLQTPRALLADDLALLLGASAALDAASPASPASSAEAAPVAPVEPEPVEPEAGAFPHFGALRPETRAQLAPLIRQAVRAPKKVAGAVKKLVKALGATLEAVAALDLVALEMLGSIDGATLIWGKNPNRDAAAELFGAARKLALKAPVPGGLEAELAIFERFSSAGAVGNAELAGLLGRVKKLPAAGRPDPERLIALLIEAVAKGDPPEPELTAALVAWNPAAAAPVLAGWIRRGARTLEEVPSTATFVALAPHLGALFAEDAVARRWAMVFLPTAPGARRRSGGWLDFVATTGLVPLATREHPALLEVFVWRLVTIAERTGAQDVLQTLATLLPPLTASLRAHDRSLCILAAHWGRMDAWTLDVGRVVLDHGLSDDATEQDWLPATEALLARRDDLANDHPDLLDAQVLELLLSVEAPLSIPTRMAHRRLSRWPTPTAWYGLDRLRHHPILGPLAERDCPSEAGEVAFLERLASRGTVGTLESAVERLDRLVASGDLQPASPIAKALREVDMARLLQHQLNAGLMDEWGWPAWDEACDRLGDAVHTQKAQADGSPPFRVLHDAATGRTLVAGPEEVVFDGVLPFESPPAFRWMTWVDDDVELVTWNHPHDVYLVRKGEIRRGDRSAGSDVAAARFGPTDWTDGTSRWRRSSALVRADGLGRAVYEHDQPFSDAHAVWRIDPATGDRVATELPAWMRDLLGDGDALLTEATFLDVAPRAGGGPLGAADGLVGLAVVRRANGHEEAVGIDGRRLDGAPRIGSIQGLIRFPEREAIHPLVTHMARDILLMSDGETPLTSTEATLSVRYGYASVPRLPVPWWHLMEPRDLPGSRALRDASLEVAQTLLAAAIDARRAASSVQGVDEELEGYEGLQVTMHGEPVSVDPGSHWPGLGGAVRAALPAITSRRLLAGVARMAITAAEAQDTLDRLLERVPEAAGQAGQGAGAPLVSLSNRDAFALGELYGYDVKLWWNRPADPLGQQLREVAAFLCADGDGSGTTASVAPSRLPWHRLVDGMGEVLWRVLAPGTPSAARDSLVAILRLWAETGLSRFADRVRRLVLTFDGMPVPGIDRDHPDRLLDQGSRYFLRHKGIRDGRQVFEAIVVAKDGDLRLPHGAELIESHPARCLALVPEVLALLEDRGPAPWVPGVAEALTRATGLLEPSSALLWTAAVRPWNQSRALRKELGFSATELELGVEEVGSLDPGPVLSAAFPAHPSALYAPLEPGPDGVRPVDALAAAWNAAYGRRPRVSLATACLAADAVPQGRGARVDMSLRMVEDPSHRDAIARDTVWVVRPTRPFGGFGNFAVPPGWPKHAEMGDEDVYPSHERAFSGWVLRQLLPYLAWAYVDLPAGDPVRIGAGKLASRIALGLANPDLLLLAGVADLSRTGTPGEVDAFVASLLGEPYVAADGGPSAPGVDLGPLVVTWPVGEVRNGFFVAARPSRMTDPATRRRVLEDWTLVDGHRLSHLHRFALVGGADFESFLIWSSEGFQALCDELLSADVPAGAFAADPRVACPGLVHEIGERLDLDEEAATLFLQHLALADPCPSRLMRINGWSKQKLSACSALLVTRGLLVEGKQPRTARKLFLPGPVELPLSPAVPIEVGKRDLYTPGPVVPPLTPSSAADWQAPFGSLQPVRPTRAMFEAAWARRSGA